MDLGDRVSSDASAKHAAEPLGIWLYLPVLILFCLLFFEYAHRYYFRRVPFAAAMFYGKEKIPIVHNSIDLLIFGIDRFQASPFGARRIYDTWAGYDSQKGPGKDGSKRHSAWTGIRGNEMAENNRSETWRRGGKPRHDSQ